MSKFLRIPVVRKIVHKLNELKKFFLLTIFFFILNAFIIITINIVQFVWYNIYTWLYDRNKIILWKWWISWIFEWTNKYIIDDLQEYKFFFFLSLKEFINFIIFKSIIHVHKNQPSNWDDNKSIIFLTKVLIMYGCIVYSLTSLL